MLVRDVNGRSLFHLDGDRVRDEHGKPVAARAGSDHHARDLSELAAAWMRDGDSGASAPWQPKRSALETERKFMLDLHPADVAQQSTKAEFGTPKATEFIADQVSPLYYIKNDRGVFYAENEVDGIQIAVANASQDAPASEINPVYSTPTKFVCAGYALAGRIPRPIANNADFDVKARLTRILCRKLRLARELRVATLLTKTANWAGGNVNTVTTNKWNGGTTPNQINDMFVAMAKSWLPVDTMVMVESALQYFFGSNSAANTNTRDYVQAGGPMPNVLVARAIYEVAGVPAYVWGPANPINVPLVRVGTSPTDLQSCVTLRWLGDSAGGATVEGMLVREFFDSTTDAYWVVVAHSDTEQFVNNKIGALIAGAIQ